MRTGLPQIDISKSIHKERMIYKKTGWYIFGVCLTYFYLVIFIAMTVFFLITYYNVGFIDTVCGFFIVWITACLITVNKLVKIDRIAYPVEKDKIIQTFESFDRDVEFVNNNSKLIRAFVPSIFSWGIVYTVIIAEENIYLNFSSLGRGLDMISPFHAVFNYILCRRFAVLLTQK